jgi:hypothetical protein
MMAPAASNALNRFRLFRMWVLPDLDTRRHNALVHRRLRFPRRFAYGCLFRHGGLQGERRTVRMKIRQDFRKVKTPKARHKLL